MIKMTLVFLRRALLPKNPALASGTLVELSLSAGGLPLPDNLDAVYILNFYWMTAMKNVSFFFLLLVLAVSVTAASGQNTVKLFDAMPISLTSTSVAWNPRTPMIFNSKDVYLSCPIGGPSYTYISGPNSGNLIVDNFFTMNGDNICPDEWNCFAGAFANPGQAVGLPMDSAYMGVEPIDVSSRITGSGVYSFVLSDFSYFYGNSDIYLHTSCSLGSYVCHRNNGNAAPKTLAVEGKNLAAHLAHGDTEGPCS